MTNTIANHHHSVLITSPKHHKNSLAHQSSFSSPKSLHSKSTNSLALPLPFTPSSPSSTQHNSTSPNNAREKAIGLSPSNAVSKRRNSGLFPDKIDIIPVPSFNISPSSHENSPNTASKRLRTFSFHSSSSTHLTIDTPSTKLPSLASPKSPSPSSANNASPKHSVLKRNNSAHIVLMRDHSPQPVQIPKKQQTFASPSPTPFQNPSPTNLTSAINHQQINTTTLSTNNNQSLMAQDQSFSVNNRKIRSASHTPTTTIPQIIETNPSKESKGVLGPIDRSNMRVTLRKKANSKKDFFRSQTPTHQSPKKENGTISFAEKFTIAVETQKQIEALSDYVKLDEFSFGFQNEEYKSTSNYDVKHDEEMYKNYIDQNQDMKTLFDVHNLVREYVSSRSSHSKKTVKDMNKMVLEIIRRYNQRTLKKNKSEQTIKTLLK